MNKKNNIISLTGVILLIVIFCLLYRHTPTSITRQKALSHKTLRSDVYKDFYNN